MSEEFKVPPDLAFFEHQLRALPIEDSGIDRDETLYQAGWSAALSSKESMKTGVHWFWPGTTAVMATAAAILLIIVIQQQGLMETVNDATAMNRSQVEIEPTVLSESQNEIASQWLQSDFEKRMTKSQLTTFSHRLDLPSELLPHREFELDGSAPKSIFQLREELTPSNKSKIKTEGQKRVWDWFSQKVGEVI